MEERLNYAIQRNTGRKLRNDTSIKIHKIVYNPLLRLTLVLGMSRSKT
jgi:hypothetical protein